MSDDAYPVEEPYTLIISDQGVAIAAAHAESHAAGGDDELALELSQITDAGTMAAQDANAVNITGGSATGLTSVTSGHVNFSGTGTINGPTITMGPGSSFSGGTIEDTVIGASFPKNGNFDILDAFYIQCATTVEASSLQLTEPVAVAYGGTGASTQAGARAGLGCGTISTQNNSNVNITGGTVAGVAINNVYISGTSSASLVNLAVSGTVSLTSALPINQGGTGATNDSAARTALGLEIGTNVQGYNAKLGAIAGLTGAADKVPYFTGTSSAATFTATSFGRSLAGAADLAAAQALLGITTGGSIDYTITTQYLSGGSTGPISDSLISSSSIVIPIPVAGTLGGGTAGILEIEIDPGVGYTVTSTEATDDRTIKVLRILS